jgi:hypothetical protein
MLAMLILLSQGVLYKCFPHIISTAWQRAGLRYGGGVGGSGGRELGAEYPFDATEDLVSRDANVLYLPATRLKGISSPRTVGQLLPR